MKLIEPKVELIQQQPGLVGMYKHIERCARTCYKTEDSITENSYEKLCDKLMKAKHFAMFEHGTVYLYIRGCRYLQYMALDGAEEYEKKMYHDLGMHDNAYEVLERYEKNPYSRVRICELIIPPNNEHREIICEDYYITTNLRVIIENHWENDLEFICDSTEFHEKRITLKFTTNIGVTREGNRHRVNSIAEESTRYCNYNTDKFDNSIKFTRPTWINKETVELHACRDAETESKLYSSIINYGVKEELNWTPIDWYLYALSTSAYAYKNLIRLGWSPQQAREVLPLATKSEVVYTAFASDWRHWFDLRLVGTTGKPHPNMEQVAWLAQQELIKNNLWKLIYPDNKHE